MAVQIQMRRDSAADWTAANPILAEGEFGFESDTGNIKIGDGVAVWSALPYIADTELAAHIADASGAHAASAISYGASDVEDALNEQARFIGCRGWRSGSQSITSSTVTVVLFNAESFDTDSFHDNVTNSNRFTVPAGLDGYYLVTLNLRWAGATGGDRAADIRKNGVAVSRSSIGPNGTNVVHTLASTIVALAAGDYVEGTAWQSSGANLNVLGEDDSRSALAISRLGDL